MASTASKKESLSGNNAQRRTPFFQAKLTVNAPNDKYEQEADTIADRVLATEGKSVHELGGVGGLFISQIQRKCAECEEEEKVQMKGFSKGGEADGEVESAIRSESGGGEALGKGTRSWMESRFGTGFGNVRIHDNHQSHQINRKLNARAFTHQNHIFFNSGQYNPESSSGKKLLAHELTHVVQQTGGGGFAEQLDEEVGIGGNMIQRDLMVEPPNPTAEARELTEAEIQTAIRYNETRFHDPYNIMNVRDVIGIAQYPAVIDQEFVEAVVRWQAMFDLEQDGKMGADTTQTILAELNAAGATHEAETLAVDNTVTTVDVVPRTYNTCAPGLPFEFNWQVGFRTTMRNGFIVQRIDNTFNATMCDGSAYTGWQPIRRYWEAWSVDGNGNVRPILGGVNDMFTRPLRAGSRGNWVMRGTLYTTKTLPSSFVASSVADAGILRATLTNPGDDFLGYVANTRRVGGTWDCCAATPTHTPS